MDQKPRWANLIKHCCPLCGQPLNVGTTVVMCAAPCEFRCSLKKAGEIVAGIRDRGEERVRTPDDNMAALNNFGHNPQPRGYHDEEEEVEEV